MAGVLRISNDNPCEESTMYIAQYLIPIQGWMPNVVQSPDRLGYLSIAPASFTTLVIL
jgi:hypothetical protein